MLRFLLLIHTLFFISIASFKAKAQDFITDTTELNPRFGVFGGAGINLHHGDFELPSAPSCCNNYDFGWAMTPIIGVLIDYPYDYQWIGSVRLSYQNMGGDFTEPENTPVIINNQLVQGVFEHRLNSDFHMLTVEPMVSKRLWRSLFGRAGLRINLLMSSYYDQGEYIVVPENRGGFPDNSGRSYRNISDGDISDSRFLTLGLQLGAGYELPLNKRKWLWLIPEVYYSFNFLSPVTGTSWFTHTFRATAGIAYRKPHDLPPPPPPPANPPIAELPEPLAPPQLHASVDLVRVDSTGNELGDFKLVIEDFISLNMRPLLNYVFFDENSAEIPERYKKLNRNNVQSFNMSLLNDQNALETYYNVLNIVGLRLTQRPEAKITIIGANSDFGPEKGNKELSEARAIAVKNYLSSSWGIDPSRMKIEARNLPKESSRSDYPEGREENRRVEIVSDDWSLTEPVITVDTMRVLSNTLVRFKNYTSADAGIRHWNLKALQRDNVLLDTSGAGEPPENLDWNLEEEGAKAPQKAGNVFYQLTIEDKLGQDFRTNPEQMPVEQISIERKRMEMQADKEYEYYSLILFNYGSSALDKEHKDVVDFVKNRITPDATIHIYGHTDNLGEAEINKKISEKRAKAVASRLDIPSAHVEGIGEDELLYDNTLPEARFYCRTVRISIETPVKD